MTALSNAAALCSELRRRGICFNMDIARSDALLISITVPGERWEIEFFDDGHTELERFLSQGVAETSDIVPELLSRLG